VPDLVERLRRRVRTEVLKRLLSDPSGELVAMDLEPLLVVYGTWRGRQLAATPRRVRESKELRASAERSTHRGAYDAIVADIRAGNDLNRYLSRALETAYVPTTARPSRMASRRDRDLLLADWGLHHLHLSTTVEPDGFVSRTKDLLFAAFVGDQAYLISIYPHGSWALTAMLEVFVHNWGADGLLQSLKRVSLTQTYSDEDRLKLRQAGVFTMLSIDGVVYVPRGQTAAGTPMYVARGVQMLLCQVEALRPLLAADPRHLDSYFAVEYQQRLAQLTWAPYMSGDDIGFTTGEHVLLVGRLP